MDIVFLDGRDGDITLWQGEVDYTPQVGDDVHIASGMWNVISKTFILGPPTLVIVLLSPVTDGAWDGSADYAQAKAQ